MLTVAACGETVDAGLGVTGRVGLEKTCETSAVAAGCSNSYMPIVSSGQCDNA